MWAPEAKSVTDCDQRRAAAARERTWSESEGDPGSSGCSALREAPQEYGNAPHSRKGIGGDFDRATVACVCAEMLFAISTSRLSYLSSCPSACLSQRRVYRLAVLMLQATNRHFGQWIVRHQQPQAQPVRRRCPAALRSVRVLVKANVRCPCDAPYLSVCLQSPFPSSASAPKCPTTWVSCSCAPDVRFTPPLRSRTQAFAHPGGHSGLQNCAPAPRTLASAPLAGISRQGVLVHPPSRRAFECSRTSLRMSSGPPQLHRRL